MVVQNPKSKIQNGIKRRLTLPTIRWPLANRLALSMLCVAAVAITVLFYDLNRANRAEVEALQTGMLSAGAQELARGLDGLVNTEKSRVANLALSRAAQEFVAARPDQRSARFASTLADFSNFIDSNAPFYHAVLLLDRDGEALLATDGSYVGLRFDHTPFFQAALRGGGEPYMSDPGISSLTREPVIWLAAPVYPQQAPAPGVANREPGGVVAVALAPEEVWRYVEGFRVGSGGYAMLLDQYGIRVAHGRDRRFVFRSLTPLPPETWTALQAEGRFAGLERIADTSNHTLMEYVRGNPAQSVFIEAPGVDSGRVYYSAAPMQTRDWTVVAMMSEREVLAPASNATLRGLSATVIVVLLLGLLVTWMVQRMVRPVPRLAKAAAKIAQGDLATPIETQGMSELRVLSENFEIMRRRLEQSRDELATWAGMLEQRVARRSQELTALSEVVASASRTQSREALLQTALQQALHVMGAEMGGIWIARADDSIHLSAQAGFNAELAEQLTEFAFGEGLLGRAQAEGTALALDDISVSPRLARAIVKAEGLHAFAAVPLRIHGRTLGVMGLFSHSRQGFSPEAVALATSIAQQIALTLDNIALVEQVQTQAHNVAALQERERIAGEIHDGIAQNLSYLYLQIDQLSADAAARTPEMTQSRLAHMQDVLDRTIGDVRQFIARLQESEPPPAPLGERLRIEAQDLARELPLRVTVAVPQEHDTIVSADVATELTRIVGEALRNAHRHGQAAGARVDFARSNGHASLRISDDGIGFDPERPPNDGRGHYGLTVMRARAARIGGELYITSRPGAGACVEVRWPIEGVKG
jgi:two-component system nitrate/nitrite sensor histidine kinase NarX